MKIAGVIGYYPLACDKMDPGVPTLVMIGDKDPFRPAKSCRAGTKDKPNVEVVVYPDAGYGFAAPGALAGGNFYYNETAAADAVQRAGAFMAAYMK